MTTDIYGPNTTSVAAFIEHLRTLTPAQADRLAAAWDAVWDAARYATRVAAWGARYAAWNAAAGDAAQDAWDAAGDAGDAAGDAAAALVLRDRISPEHFALFVAPFVEAGFGEWLGETA